MIDPSGFEDLRKFIKRRLIRAKYRIGTKFYETNILDVSIEADGTVRAQLTITPSNNGVIVNRVELYNNESSLWAHQDCSIEIAASQRSVLYWFDFTITEKEESE